MDQTAIVLNTGAVLNGRALAQTQVTLDSNTILFPTLTVATPAPSVTPAVPATPATPAVPTVTPAVPATPATPAVTQTTATTATSVVDTGCVSGNKFSTVTGKNCVAVATTAETTDAGCLSGNKFSIVTGKNCNSEAGTSANVSISSGQQIKAVMKNLRKGIRDAEVKTLQDFLVSQNKGPAAQALANITETTTYFGEMTRAALAEFQAAVGISPAVGNFGAITRAYMSSHY